MYVTTYPGGLELTSLNLMTSLRTIKARYDQGVRGARLRSVPAGGDFPCCANGEHDEPLSPAELRELRDDNAADDVHDARMLDA